MLASAVHAADARRPIAIELVFGADYTSLVGEQMVADAKLRGEQEVAAKLDEAVRYFDFVTSGEPAPHKLSLRIEHPDAVAGAGGSAADLRDYYLFASVDGRFDPTSFWVFRDAASNVAGAESADQIVTDLGKQVLDRQNVVLIVEKLLAQVSFTEQGKFQASARPGWVIQGSRTELCIRQNSEIRVETTIPGADIEDDFVTEVKRNPQHDHESTSSIAKSGEDLGPLLSAPDQARIVGVYVSRYDQECPTQTPVVETAPASASFPGG